MSSATIDNADATTYTIHRSPMLEADLLRARLVSGDRSALSDRVRLAVRSDVSGSASGSRSGPWGSRRRR